MTDKTKSLDYWLKQYSEHFHSDFPVIIGWNGDRIAVIKQCLKNDQPVDVKQMESEIEYDDVIY